MKIWTFCIHLKLAIALAMPVLNEWKNERINDWLKEWMNIAQLQEDVQWHSFKSAKTQLALSIAGRLYSVWSRWGADIFITPAVGMSLETRIRKKHPKIWVGYALNVPSQKLVMNIITYVTAHVLLIRDAHTYRTIVKNTHRHPNSEA